MEKKIDEILNNFHLGKIDLIEVRKQLLILYGVMWRCSRQFRMKDTKEVCFKNGKLYEQVKEQPLTLKDEDGIAHELAPHWIKWFHNAT